MHSKHFGYNLVGIGSTIKSACPSGMIRLTFIIEHLVLVDFPFCIELPGMGFFLVWQAGRHGSAGNKNHGQVTELQSPHQ